MRDLEFLRLPAVKAVTGLGRSTIYHLQALGEFPRAVHLTRRTVAWLRSDVETWMKDKIERGQKPFGETAGGEEREGRHA